MILTVKIETRHPVEGQFGSEFPAICNHCGVMTAWYRKIWKFCEQFLRYFGKTTPYGKIFKILFRKFLPPHRSTLSCWNVVKGVRREIGEIVRYLPHKQTQNKISTASTAFQTVATARIAPKICQSQPPTMCSQCFGFYPNRYTLVGVIAERVNTVFAPYRVFPYSPEVKLRFGLIITRRQNESSADICAACFKYFECMCSGTGISV